MPISNVHRGVGIGVRLISAPSADISLFLSLVQRTAGVAGFGCVVRTHRLHFHPRCQRFVPDKPLKLVERPVVPVLSGIRLRALTLLRRRSNSFEVFQDQASVLALCQRHQFFAEAVVDVRDNAPFFRLQRFDCPEPASPLERAAAFGIQTPDMPDFPSEVVATTGTFCPRSTPIQRPVFSASGTSIDAERQAYQMPFLDRTSFKRPFLARPSSHALSQSLWEAV